MDEEKTYPELVEELAVKEALKALEADSIDKQTVLNLVEMDKIVHGQDFNYAKLNREYELRNKEFELRERELAIKETEVNLKMRDLELKEKSINFETNRSESEAEHRKRQLAHDRVKTVVSTLGTLGGWGVSLWSMRYILKAKDQGNIMSSGDKGLMYKAPLGINWLR